MTTADPAYSRRRGDRFIQTIEWLAAIFVAIVTIDTFVSVHTYALFDKVVTTRAENVLTYDLHLPTWPFFAVAWIGDFSAVILIAVRTWRLIVSPEALGGHYQIKPTE